MDNAAQPPRPFTAADLTALPGLAAIRRRPRMYFGVDQHDPTLPGQVMRYAVHGLLDEASPGTLSRIEVVIESNLVFSITDDGLGLPVDPDRPGLPSRLAQLLTMLMAGGGPGLAPVTAMCSALVADVWHDGFHYRQWADWEHPAPPMQARGRTDRHGTRLLAHLDSSYLGPAAALPFDSAWLSGRAGLAIPATVHIGITDKRHGQPTATAG